MSSDQSKKNTNRGSFRTIAPWIFSPLILLGYGWLVVQLIDNVDVADQKWIRLIYIFGSVEAIAFIAVGFIFGREVHRSQVKKAEEREKAAKNKADKAKSEKRELAIELLDKLPSPPDAPTDPGEARILADPGISGPHMEYLREQARKHLL